MSKKAYAAILDDIARAHISDHIDLAPRILTQIRKSKGAVMQPRVKILMAAIVALLVLAFLLVRVPAVAGAMQRMLSRFIPGIGMVDVSTTRVLAEPVSATRDGITVTVEQLVADSQHTVLVYKVDGLSETIQSPPGENDCMESPRLRLTNGAELSYPRGNASSSVSISGEVTFSANYEFLSTPAGMNELTFILPCLERMERGALPENWEIPLILVPAPSDMTTYPVIEVLPTISVGPSVSATAAPAVHNFSLSVERVVPLDGSYRVYGTLDGGGNGLMLRDASARLLDANDREIPGARDLAFAGARGEGLPVVFEAATEYIPAPVTLVVDSVMADIFAVSPGGHPPSFTIDVGQHPQIDQVWELNRDMHIAGYSLRVVTARFIERNGEYGFDFQMRSPDVAVHSAWLLDFARSRGQYGGAFLGYNGEPFNTEMTYEAGFMPSGTVTISVSSISVTLYGPWQVTLTLPAVEEPPGP